jgi:hypothetical protein
MIEGRESLLMVTRLAKWLQKKIKKERVEKNKNKG